jgi:DNA-binding MarR family transcriptional regulator
MSQDPCPVNFYSAAGYSADESVGYLMKRVLMAIAQAADKRLEPQGITHAQWGPLFMLRNARASTVAELARELQTDPGAMTRLLDRLETKGFCRRLRSTDDRRVVRIELTPEGEVAADKVPSELAEIMNAHLAGFSKDEWNQLKGFLQRMLDNAELSVAKGLK